MENGWPSGTAVWVAPTGAVGHAEQSAAVRRLLRAALAEPRQEGLLWLGELPPEEGMPLPPETRGPHGKPYPDGIETPAGRRRIRAAGRSGSLPAAGGGTGAPPSALSSGGGEIAAYRRSGGGVGGEGERRQADGRGARRLCPRAAHRLRRRLYDTLGADFLPGAGRSDRWRGVGTRESGKFRGIRLNPGAFCDILNR